MSIKRWQLLCIVIFAGISAYIALPYFKVTPDPVKIYKTVEPVKKSELQSVVSVETENTNLHEQKTNNSRNPDHLVEHSEIQEPINFGDTTDMENIVSGISGEVDTETSLEKIVDVEGLSKELLDDWNDYARVLPEKYPLLFDTKALQHIAQTATGRQQIKRQVESMIDETLNEFERLFNQLPKEYASEVLDSLEVELKQQPQGLSPEYIEKALDRMRSRIH